MAEILVLLFIYTWDPLSFWAGVVGVLLWWVFQVLTGGTSDGQQVEE